MTRRISPEDIKTKTIFDAYAGLLKVGYNRPGATRALTILGITPDVAKAIADLYDERHFGG